MKNLTMILLLGVAVTACVHRQPTPCPCQDQTPTQVGAGWAPAPAPVSAIEMTPPEKMAPRLRPENCPDDGIHILINNICVDTNGK